MTSRRLGPYDAFSLALVLTIAAGLLYLAIRQAQYHSEQRAMTMRIECLERSLMIQTELNKMLTHRHLAEQNQLRRTPQ